MSSKTGKSYRIHLFCAILVIAFLLCVPLISAWSSLDGGRARASEANSEIKADPLRRLPASPEEANKRLQEQKIGWPAELGGEGDRSADAVSAGVRVSIPYDTVTGRTTHASTDVQVVLTQGMQTYTVNTTTNASRFFEADLADATPGPGDIKSGDTVTVTDSGGGAPVVVNCTLTCAMDAPNDVVSGTALAGRSVDVYIRTPSTYYGDIPPGVAHKKDTGTPWDVDFTGTLKLRYGDAAFVYSTDTRGNIVMNVANDGGTLVVYPQYDDVMGYYLPGQLLTVKAAGISGNNVDAGTAGDGFFDAWFYKKYNIVPPDLVTCQMGATNRSIMVANVSARCDPATNHVTGSGPANRVMRLTMSPYSNPVTYQVTINANGNFNIDLGTRYTATGSDVYNIAWYDADCDCVVYEFQAFSWYLAEGYTGTTSGGGYFDTYVLLQNPGSLDAPFTMTFQVQNGTAAAVAGTVLANSRMTVHLDELPGLSEASVSTKVTSTTGAPLNAERAMYFKYVGDPGGHDSIGTLTPCYIWYLAEGYTGAGFDTWVLVQNPGTTAANVTLKFQLDSGTAPDKVISLPAGTRQSVYLNDLPGLSAGVSVSTKVTSDVRVVVERAMYFRYSGKRGGHDSIGVNLPRKTWHMAEGYTGAGFDTWVLVQNPTTKNATVTMQFQLDSGTAPDKVISLPAGTRQQVRLNELPGLSAGVSVSTKVTSDVDVVAERAMYFLYDGKDGGHCSKAAEEPSTNWYLPEGYTGAGFDTWVLVQNPGSESATVTLKFQVENGSAPNKVISLPAGTRQQVHLNELEGLSDGVSVSTEVVSTVPVVAERSMYFNYGGILGGHNSVGIPFTP